MKKEILQNIIKSISSDLVKIENSNLSTLSLVKNIKVKKTNTNGFYAQLFNDKKLKGIDIWLDEFTNTNKSTIALTYWSKKKENDVISVLLAKKFKQIKQADTILVDGNSKLKIPLNDSYFDKYILETFDHIFITKYYSFAIKNARSFNNDCKELIISDLLELIFYLSKTNEDNIDEESDYSAYERKVVRLHEYFERKSKLARKAKEKVNYICQICEFSYLEKYGEIGINYAEAHHIVPLSKLNNEQKTIESDLICVCANCHRMLHRMDGKLSDIEILKNIIKYANA